MQLGRNIGETDARNVAVAELERVLIVERIVQG